LILAANQMHVYVFCPNFGSLDFGKLKFWLAIILVEQKLVANQSNPTRHLFHNNSIHNLCGMVWAPSKFSFWHKIKCLLDICPSQPHVCSKTLKYLLPYLPSSELVS